MNKIYKVVFSYLLLLILQLFIYDSFLHLREYLIFTNEEGHNEEGHVLLFLVVIVYILISYTIAVVFTDNNKDVANLYRSFFDTKIESYKVDDEIHPFYLVSTTYYKEEKFSNLNALLRNAIRFHLIFLPLTMPIISLLFIRKKIDISHRIYNEEDVESVLNTTIQNQINKILKL